MIDELERFKTEINLVEYLQANGWQIDSKKSTQKAAVLKNGAERVVVSRNENGHYIFFDVASGKGGTVIDFLQQQKGLSLGQIRKELRPLLGASSSSSSLLPPGRRFKLERISRGEQEIERVKTVMSERWAKLKKLQSAFDYLQERGINQIDRRFANLRQDERGNVCFPFYRDGVVIGWELKGRNFTGFSKGGKRAGLYATTNISRATTIVIVESGIDALSHALLFKTGDDVAYVSIGGQLTDRQLELLKKLATKRKVSFVVATDNDEAGERFAQRLQLVLDAERQLPKQKDWNDDLKAFLEEVERASARSRPS